MIAMIAMDTSLQQLLGAPENVRHLNLFIYTRDVPLHRYLPRPNEWTPDWVIFDQSYYNDSQTKCGIDEIINIVLTIQGNPIPLCTFSNLLSYEYRMKRGKVDYDTLLVAAANPKTSKQVFQHLLYHIAKFKIIPSSTLNEHSSKLLRESARYNSIGVAEAIIEMNPQALDMVCSIGLRPIHHVMSYRLRSEQRSNMVRLLIKEGMKYGVGGKDGCGGVLVQQQKMRKSKYGRSSTGSSPIELALYYLRQQQKNRNNESEDEWECLTLCYDAIKSTNLDFHLINYIIGMEVDMSNMIHEIVRRYNIDLNAADLNGMTPLSMAIRERKSCYIRTFLLIQNNSNVRIRCCEMNGTTYENCYPLHIALNEGIKWDEGLKEILQGYYEALTMVDPVTGLYPFMIASNHPLDDIYHLLRSNTGIADNCAMDCDLLQDGISDKSSFIHHFVVGIVFSIAIFLFRISVNFN